MRNEEMIDRDDDESPRRKSVKQKGRKNQKFKNNIKQIDINNLKFGDDEEDNPFDEFEGVQKFFESGN
jgi:hypothetical protein